MSHLPADACIAGLDVNDPRVAMIRKVLDSRPLGLREYHRVGTLLADLAGEPVAAGRGSGWRAKLAGSVGLSVSMLNKCLQFGRGYDDEGLRRLERSGVGFARATIVLSAGRERRFALLRLASSEGWTDADLQKRIQKEKGWPRPGGRKPGKLHSHGLLADASQLKVLLDRVNQFFEQVWEPNRVTYRTEAAKLTEEGRKTASKLLSDTTELAGKVSEGLSKVSADLAAYHERLPCGKPTAPDRAAAGG